MGRSARQRSAAPAGQKAPHRSATTGAASASALDRIIHERLRLGIVSALAAADTMSFNDLKRVLGTTDGNLSVHARKLEDAGYVQCTKSFDGRTPRTEFKLTTAGRRALEKYVAHMESLIAAMKK